MFNKVKKLFKGDSIKQAIVVRGDLKLGKGKAAAQSCHASLAAYLKVKTKDSRIADDWVSEGMKKIVLKVSSEKELKEYFGKCKESGSPCEIIRDAGHTQIDPGTITCFGAGPGDENEIDKVLGKLKLL